MRRDISGLGPVQVLLCLALLSTVGLSPGCPVAASLIAGTGIGLTPTAIVVQMPEERQSITQPKGHRMAAILLRKDRAIVPLRALVAFLAPAGKQVTLPQRLIGVATGPGSIAILMIAGRYLLNPFVRPSGPRPWDNSGTGPVQCRGLHPPQDDRHLRHRPPVPRVPPKGAEVDGWHRAANLPLCPMALRWPWAFSPPKGIAVLPAIIILSMALTPLFVMLHVRHGPKPDTSAKGMARPQDEGAHVMLIGLGRVSQIVSQTLFARAHSIITIDTEPDMI